MHQLKYVWQKQHRFTRFNCTKSWVTIVGRIHLSDNFLKQQLWHCIGLWGVFKAASFLYFLLTAHVKGVACRNKRSEKYRMNLQFPSPLQRVLPSFSSLLWFYSPQLSSFVSCNRQTKLATSWWTQLSKYLLKTQIYITGIAGYQNREVAKNQLVQI